MVDLWAMSAQMCTSMQFHCTPLRIKKALGISGLGRTDSYKKNNN